MYVGTPAAVYVLGFNATCIYVVQLELKAYNIRIYDGLIVAARARIIIAAIQTSLCLLYRSPYSRVGEGHRQPSRKIDRPAQNSRAGERPAFRSRSTVLWLLVDHLHCHCCSLPQDLQLWGPFKRQLGSRIQLVLFFFFFFLSLCAKRK